MLSTNAIVEAPFIDGAGSFILTGRKSYQSDLYNDILESVTDQDQNAQAGLLYRVDSGLGQSTEPESYYDLNAKPTYRLPNDDKLSISVYNGADELDNSREIGGESSFLSDRCDAFNGQGPFGGIFCNDFSFSVATVDLSEWGNTGMSAKLSRQWSNRFYSNFVLSGSQYFSNRDREIDRDVIFIEDDPSNIPTSSQSSSNEVNQLDDLTCE